MCSSDLVDVAKYHVLCRRRSHVFLTLCFEQRKIRSGTLFIQGLCSAQAGVRVTGSENEKYKLVLLSKHKKIIIEWSFGCVKIDAGPMGQES